eukprot:366545-Chlamydomonas_euryale.AAC.7
MRCACGGARAAFFFIFVRASLGRAGVCVRHPVPIRGSKEDATHTPSTEKGMSAGLFAPTPMPSQAQQPAARRASSAPTAGAAVGVVWAGCKGRLESCCSRVIADSLRQHLLLHCKPDTLAAWDEDSRHPHSTNRQDMHAGTNSRATYSNKHGTERLPTSSRSCSTITTHPPPAETNPGTAARIGWHV